jgi:hypothetical protein
MERKATWGAVPWPCSCTASHADCACKHGALLTAVFDPTIKVPKQFVASEPSLRKKCHRLKGTAGPKRKRLLAEMQKDKVKKASKIQFMHMEASSGAAAGGAAEASARVSRGTARRGTGRGDPGRGLAILRR